MCELFEDFEVLFTEFGKKRGKLFMGGYYIGGIQQLRGQEEGEGVNKNSTLVHPGGTFCVENKKLILKGKRNGRY